MSNNTDMMGDDSDGAMRRATIVVCANSGTEVPRYGICGSSTNSQFVVQLSRSQIICDEPFFLYAVHRRGGERRGKLYFPPPPPPPKGSLVIRSPEAVRDRKTEAPRGPVGSFGERFVVQKNFFGFFSLRDANRTQRVFVCGMIGGSSRK